jgi:glycerophosphoryl diester phosphodiesterase
VAHRGASAAALENCLPAFRLARQQRADGVELDAMISADGQVVVFHDDDLARLAPGRRERVADLRLAELREVELVGPAGRGHIPTLSEVIEELGPDLLVNIELKTPQPRQKAWLGQALAVEVARLVRRHDLGRRALVSSFNPMALARFRAAAPMVPSGLLFATDQKPWLRRACARHVLRPLALHPEAVMVTARSVRRWRREGYALNVWTVDDPAELARLRGLGVDGVITNDPEAARTVLT